MNNHHIVSFYEICSIKPDWTATMTIQQAEKELVDFQFKGIGIYQNKDDSLLVLPTGDDNYYRFFVYNGRNLIEICRSILELPIHY